MDYNSNCGIHFYILFTVIMCTVKFSVSQVKVCAFYDLPQSNILSQPYSNIGLVMGMAAAVAGALGRRV